MEYRRKESFESMTWLVMNGLIWFGVAGVAWNVLKPGGWLYWLVDLIVREQPVSLYYLAVGVVGLAAGKVWLDSIDPRACRNLLTAIWAFAGTFFVLSLMLPL